MALTNKTKKLPRIIEGEPFGQRLARVRKKRTYPGLACRKNGTVIWFSIQGDSETFEKIWFCI